MKDRVAAEQRRLADAQRERLKALLGAIPEVALPSHPAVRRVLDYGLTLKVPWFAPTHGAGLRYMVELDCIDEALHHLGLLARCTDWGEPPPEPDQPATGWVFEDA